MNKDKNIKIRMNSTDLEKLEKKATETNSSKSKVIRNSIPTVVTSKEFDNLLTIHNLYYLEEKAKECIEYFSENKILAIEEVSNEFPAYVEFPNDPDESPVSLRVKYPTYKLSFTPDYEFDIQRLLEKLSEDGITEYQDFFRYRDTVILFNQEYQQPLLADFLLGLKPTLEENNILMQRIIGILDELGIGGTISPSYYIKPYEIEITEDKKYVIGITV